MTPNKTPYRIIIPYLPSAAQGRELEYAIAGWRQHFIEPHIIYVVGEGLDAIRWMHAPDVQLIESKRVPDAPGQYRQHMDYVSCLRKVRALHPDEEGFILVADDCYAVNDFDIADVKLLKMLEPDFSFRVDSPNPWRRDKMKTKQALLDAGKPTRNFTTHLPQWFDWKLLEDLWNIYDMEHSSYVVEDLYYNTYYARRIPFRLNKDTDNFKYGIYEQGITKERLDAAGKSKIWITNSPQGWSPELETWLQYRLLF